MKKDRNLFLYLLFYMIVFYSCNFRQVSPDEKQQMALSDKLEQYYIPYVATSLKVNASDIKLESQEKYFSTDKGITEYILYVHYSDKKTKYFYANANRPDYIEMGADEQGNFYFFSAPQQKYRVLGTDGGYFILVNPDESEQTYTLVSE